MILRQFLPTDLVGFSSVLGCGDPATGIVVDPIAEVEFYLAAAEAAGMKIDYEDEVEFVRWMLEDVLPSPPKAVRNRAMNAGHA